MELCFNEMTVMKNGALPEDIALCAQAGFSATERFSADHHLLPFFIYHQDIDGIRVYVGFYVVRNERIFDSVVCRDLEGIADAHVIGGKSHNTAEKSTVRTMTVIGFGKRSIKGKFYFFKRTGEKLSCKQSDSGSSRSMGA